MERLPLSAQQQHWRPLLALGLLLMLTLWLYHTAVTYGFFWDDPVWYGHAIGKTWWQTLLPTTDFQFYRPFSTLYVWLFLQAEGTFAAEWLHRFQIGYHLAAIVLAYGIGRRLALGWGTAVAVTALFALYPFSYQAVAWAAPNQPMAGMLQSGAWLAYLWARPLPGLSISKRPRGWLAVSLLLYLLALTVQESSVAVAVVPLLYEFIIYLPISNIRSFWDVLKMPRQMGWWAAVLFPLAGLSYFIIWTLAPRQAGITGLVLDGRNPFYLLQGLIYPLLGRPGGYPHDYKASQVGILLLSVVVTAMLLALAARRRRGRVALFGLGWAVVSLLPVLVGLGFAYISLAARLFYAPALGVALLWGAALWPSARAKEPLWAKVISVAVVLLICLQSVWLLRSFERVWQPGLVHLQKAIMALHEQGDGRLLFLNFPDRYTPKQEPYPIGYWGMTLAPVVVGLDAFPPLLLGESAVSQSQAIPWVGQSEQEAGPNVVDMRGIIIQPDELAALAENVDEVYVSRYLADGRFQLQPAGHYADVTVPICETVLFGGAICLHETAVTQYTDAYEVTLTWSTIEPLPPEWTIFTHLGILGQPPTAQADGDTWQGALPLADWPTQRLIVDTRSIPVPRNDTGLVWQIGVYNWVTGERVTAVNANGQPMPDNVFILTQ
ncbi:MAG: hypothetical protein GY796_11805 [Chloroflexi bacterium]|nr:hypothetical protein [Chloroflexota bacterium]